MFVVTKCNNANKRVNALTYVHKIIVTEQQQNSIGLI
jgi:hypothetical protein